MAKISPFRVWLDTDGTPLNGGKIYTYITSTSTPKATYTDAGGGTALPNPVVLDANGCKTMYLAQDTAYRFIVKDSLGTTLETIDEITPVTAFATISGGNIDVTSPDQITSTGTLTLNPSNGIVTVGQFTLPTSAPSVNQVLTASSSSTTVWSNPSGSVVQDTQPQLGGNLDTNNHNIRFYSTYGIDDDVGNKHLHFIKTASAVNYLNITNAATGTAPTITTAGSDTNIGLTVTPKGTGVFTVSGPLTVSGLTTFNGGFTVGSANITVTTAYGLATSNGQVLKVNDAASAVNYLQLNTAATGNGVTWSAVGSDSNVSIGLTPKGSGAIVLGANTITNTACTTGQVLIGTGSGTAAFGSGSTLSTPYIAKAWCTTAAGAATTIVAGENVASIVSGASQSTTITTGAPSTFTAGATTKYTVTFTTPFADANYACIVSPNCSSSAIPGATAFVYSKAAGSCIIVTSQLFDINASTEVAFMGFDLVCYHV